MTKRMIDADALLGWVKKEKDDLDLPDKLIDVSDDISLGIFKSFESFKNKINELANIDAEQRAYKRTLDILNHIILGNQIEISQLEEKLAEKNAEKNAEKDPWCYDMEKAPKDGRWFLGKIVCSNPNVGGFDAVRWSTQSEKWYNYSQDMILSMVAWMPIPEPKGGQDE